MGTLDVLTVDEVTAVLDHAREVLMVRNLQIVQDRKSVV